MDSAEARKRFEDPAFQAEQRRLKDKHFRAMSMRPSEVFRRRLRETREARGLTQAGLAQRMTASGTPLSQTGIQHIESGSRSRLSLDEALALTEGLYAVPAYMLTPPEGKLLRLGESLALSGTDILEWLVSGLPYISDHSPPEELTDDVRRQQFEATLVRLAHRLVDAMRFDDAETRAREIPRAVNAIVREVRHWERQHD